MTVYKKRYIYWLFAVFFLSGCSQFSALYKKQPRVGLSLPAGRQQEAPKSVADSLVAPPKEIVFVRSDGEAVSLNVSAEWDSVHKENLTSVALDEVVISAQTRRNTAERDGKINVEFVVTVPLELQRRNWMVNVFPMLQKGEVSTDSLKELRFTGEDFRRKQESDYKRYERFLSGIIPDTVDFYRTFVNYGFFERYLEKLSTRKKSLERRWNALETKKNRPDPVLLRFEAFNRRMRENDSLLHLRMQADARKAVERKYKRLEELERRVNDTVRYTNPVVLSRLRSFNAKQLEWEQRRKDNIARRRENYYKKLEADSLRYERRLAAREQRARDLVERKKLFYRDYVAKKRHQIEALEAEKPSLELPDPIRDRFSYFNNKMREKQEKLRRKQYEKAARKRGKEELAKLKSFVEGTTVPGQVAAQGGESGDSLNQSDNLLGFLPVYRLERAVDDTTYMAARLSRWQRRMKRISDYSVKDITEHYGRKVKPRRQVSPSDHKAFELSLVARLQKRLPAARLQRPLPDSVYYVKPSARLLEEYEAAHFNPAEVLAQYEARYERRRSKSSRFNLDRELVNIYSKKQRYEEKQQELQSEIDRIASLDSTDLMKRFYNTKKIERNEALKARKGEKFHELVRFPYNPEAKLDTVITSSDTVYYLYSEKIPADENTSRLYVRLEGNVVDYSGNQYVLPASDTLTYFVSSMTKFVDETPRYVQRVVTRDAEANTQVNFTFPSGKSKLDRALGDNEKELARVKELTTALMTDPVYIIDSLTLYAGSSPEGVWTVNERLSRERAESIRGILVNDFRALYDSLNISMAIMLDEQGNVMAQDAKPELPNLPKLLRVKWSAENWEKLAALIARDDKMENVDKILELIQTEKHPDRRETLIRSRYPKDYAYMREKLYPAIRSVDFVFSLHRRGMQKDTLFTTELDENYANGVELLKKRKYEDALEILRPYEDINTAIAYMSLGYDRAALRILNGQRETAEVRYLQGILEYRLGDETQAVLRYMRSCELNPQLKHRGNLDPELSTLIKKYDLFKEDDLW